MLVVEEVAVVDFQVVFPISSSKKQPLHWIAKIITMVTTAKAAANMTTLTVMVATQVVGSGRETKSSAISELCFSDKRTLLLSVTRATSLSATSMVSQSTFTMASSHSRRLEVAVVVIGLTIEVAEVAAVDHPQEVTLIHVLGAVILAATIVTTAQLAITIRQVVVAQLAVGIRTGDRQRTIEEAVVAELVVK